MTGGFPVPTTACIGSSISSDGVLIGHHASEETRTRARPSTGSGRAVCGKSARSLAELRVHVTKGRQIRRPRPRIELAEQRVVPLLGFQPGHAALGIVDVAEDDGISRTRLLTRGLDLTVPDLAVLFFRVVLRGVDPLHAVSALLHHAAAAH